MGNWIRNQARQWLAFGLLACALALPACRKAPPEQRLRETVATLEAAVEGRDTGAVRQVLAGDFIGPEGLDREGATRLAQMSFLQHGTVGVALGPLDVRLQDQHATVRFSAALTGGSGAPLPDAAQLYDVETGWRLEDGEWRLTSATWTPRF